MDTLNFETLAVTTDDGQTLAARAYGGVAGGMAAAAPMAASPASPAVQPGADQAQGHVPQRAVIIAPALGVPQRFYGHYARWLAQQGCVVYTFDWRGMGDSAPRHLRGYQAELTDWARHDAPAMMALVAERHPGLPISWFGHSMGGILLGLMPLHPRIDQVVTLGSGSGYSGHLGRPLRYVIGCFWHVLVPLIVARHGYFAGRRLKAVGDVPHGVMVQWKRWAQHPDFVLSHDAQARQGYANVRLPITAVYVSDDWMASLEGIRHQHAHFCNAPVQHVLLRPREHGVRRMGHFNFFHGRTGPRAWALSRAWLGLEPAVAIGAPTSTWRTAS